MTFSADDFTTCANNHTYSIKHTTCPICEDAPQPSKRDRVRKGKVTSIEEIPPMKRKGKQPRNKVTVDGINFDSQTEANRYSVLKLAQSTGIIRKLECHPMYIVSPRVVLPPAPPFRVKKVIVGAITYTPDFRYEYGGMTVIEDAKGITTKTGKNGRYYRPLISASAKKSHKMLQAQHTNVVFLVSTPVPTLREKMVSGASWWLWYGTQNYTPCAIESALVLEQSA